MSDDDLFVPIPVGTVMHRYEDLQLVYCDLRGDRSPMESLGGAFQVVFTVAERSDIHSFVCGEQDDIYGAGSGEQFISLVHDQLESFWLETHELGLQ